MMLRFLFVFAACQFACIIVAAAQTTAIRLDTLGYLPAHEKRATVAAPCAGFVVVRVTDSTKAFSGAATGPVHNADTEEDLFTLDFSALREPGEYRLEVEGVGVSAPFRIAADVYRDAFVTVTRGMYLWRCGTAVRGEYRGAVFAHEACHREDGWLDLITGEHAPKDGVGGWHDAGDYNKYVVNAGVTVGAMFQAWEDFGAQVRTLPLSIPESGGALPDFLAEIKWEIEWLLKMQAQNGSVYHKITTKRFGPFIAPEQETEPRYFTPWGSPATADFVAMLAQAGRYFAPYDAAFARECRAAAEKSYAFLQANPENHRPDLLDVRTGPYLSGDADDRLWGAAELWETTGAEEILQDLETRIHALDAKWDEDFDWNEVTNLGLITYLGSQRPGRDEALVAQVRANLLATADTLVAKRSHHGYGRALDSRYYWGCNGGVARQTLVLQAAHRVAPKPEYLETALDAIHHLLGRNVHGRSYVTGLGAEPPLFPHDRRSGGDTVAAPWPGYLVGGPHPKPIDWHDEERDARTNEIAINWNAALIYALAGFLGEQSATSSP